ncbi:hypothetical protein [Clostridium butyricum]
MRKYYRKGWQKINGVWYYFNFHSRGLNPPALDGISF